MRTALVVGGTAASGVAIVDGLRRRGFEVTIYHRGSHELPELDDLEHIHGDPHHRAAIEHDLAGRQWDVVVATYGRIRYLADALVGRTGHFVSVSGTPVLAATHGLPTREDTPYEDLINAPLGLGKIVTRIAETERAVLEAGRQGSFVASVVRYPYVYGPYAVAPLEWHVIQRVLDHRTRWIVQGLGLAITPRCASPNAAQFVLKCIDNPERAKGQIYNAVDSHQLSVREWVTAVARAANWEFEFVDIPPSLAPLGSSAVPMSGEYSWIRKSDVNGNIIRHQVLTNAKARDQIAYVDVVEPLEWINKTVEHWLERPPVVDGRDGRLSIKEFDYAAEDRLLSFWDQVRRKAPHFSGSNVRTHPYAHPKEVA